MEELINEEHRKLAILTAKNIADRLQPELGNNVANWVFDKLADDLIDSSPEELATIMLEITDSMIRRFREEEEQDDYL
jgi:hypothetical protein